MWQSIPFLIISSCLAVSTTLATSLSHKLPGAAQSRGACDLVQIANGFFRLVLLQQTLHRGQMVPQIVTQGADLGVFPL